MSLLVTTSLLWAISFGLIAGKLEGLDPDFVACARLTLSALLFLPFLRLKDIDGPTRLRLLLIGAVQFGAMYLLYIRSYQHLAAYEVALFTVFTPLWVIGLAGQLHGRGLVAGALACLGAAIIQWSPLASDSTWIGFLLVQAANLCFAWGQLAYRRLSARLHERNGLNTFGLCYLGAALVAGLAASFTTDWSRLAPSHTQLVTIAYLGLIPSGLGFFLWNRGVARVSATTLAVMNDLKVPLAVLASLTLFGERAELLSLCTGSALIATALWLARSGHLSAKVGEPL